MGRTGLRLRRNRPIWGSLHRASWGGGGWQTDLGDQWLLAREFRRSVRPKVWMLARRRGPGSGSVSATMESESPVEVCQGECLESTLNFGVYHSLVQIASKVTLSVASVVSVSAQVHMDAYTDMDSCMEPRD